MLTVEQRLKSLKNRPPDWAYKMSDQELEVKFEQWRTKVLMHKDVKSLYNDYKIRVSKQEEEVGSGAGNEPLTEGDLANVPINADIIVDDYAWLWEYFEVPYTSPSMVAKYLEEADGNPIRLIVSSGGGMIMAGTAIRSMLREYRSRNGIKIETDFRFAASMALDIGLMGDFRYMDSFAKTLPHQGVTSVSYATGDQLVELGESMRADDEVYFADTDKATGQKPGTFIKIVRTKPGGLWDMNSGESKQYGVVHRVYGSHDNLDSKASASKSSTNGNTSQEKNMSEKEVASASVVEIAGMKFYEIKFQDGSTELEPINKQQTEKEKTENEPADNADENPDDAGQDENDQSGTEDSNDTGNSEEETKEVKPSEQDTKEVDPEKTATPFEEVAKGLEKKGEEQDPPPSFEQKVAQRIYRKNLRRRKVRNRRNESSD